MRHIVMAPHSKEECLHNLDELKAAGILEQCEFGCADGDHTTYLFLDADHRAAALAMLPESLRKNAKAVALSKHSAEELKELHQFPDAAEAAGVPNPS
jgi:hypothetical protein